jgi:hypothetical protein
MTVQRYRQHLIASTGDSPRARKVGFQASLMNQVRLNARRRAGLRDSLEVAGKQSYGLGAVGGSAIGFTGAVIPPIMLPIDARSRSACSALPLRISCRSTPSASRLA